MTEPDSHHRWRLSAEHGFVLDRPRVMTILNVTPDSFSDGGELSSPELAAQAAVRAARDGADILDIGGESTRPGAPAVDAAEQIRRVVPAVRAIREAGVSLPITVDTTLRAAAEAALDAGATAVNDVSGGTADAGMLAMVAERGVGVVLMHRLRLPADDSYSDAYERGPEYSGGVVGAVAGALGESLERAMGAGVARDSVLLDPGLGFGKTVEQNLELIRRTPELVARTGRPMLSGVSRKSFVGRVSSPGAESTEPGDRLAGTLALSALHYSLGARVFRVHDTLEVRRALDAAAALETGPAATISEPSARPGRSQTEREAARDGSA